MDDNGRFLEFNIFKNKFKLQCTFKEYDRTCKAIPLSLVQMIKSIRTHSEIQIVLPTLKVYQIPLGD